MHGTIYEERVYSRWNILLLGAVALALLGMLLYQSLAGSGGERTSTDWFLVGMLGFFVVLLANFATLRIRMTRQGVTVAYGLIQQSISWGQVSGCQPDQATALKYGGWGIRMGWVNGKRRLVYNVIGSPRVVLYRRDGAFEEFAFSTQDPERVLAAVREGLGEE